MEKLNLKRERNSIKVILAILVICGMVFASEIFHEKEIIFPEIAAIVVGSFISPQFAWNTSKIRMIAGIMICAILGVGIVCYLPAPLFLQITVAYFLGRLVLMFMKVSFAPMISAIVLPVLLQTESVVYLIAAFVLTSAIVMLRWCLEKADLVKVREYKKGTIELRKEMRQIGITTMFVCILAWISLFVDFRFMIAPPLLVVFTEFANPSSKGRKKPIMTTAVITGCAVSGAICRYLFAMTLGLPLYIAAFIGCVFVLLLLKGSQVYVPPTGALMVLAMLIPEAAVITFPIQVLIGCSVMIFFDMMVFRKKEEAVLDERSIACEPSRRLPSM